MFFYEQFKIRQKTKGKRQVKEKGGRAKSNSPVSNFGAVSSGKYSAAEGGARL
jgi:hypothetical protein